MQKISLVPKWHAQWRTTKMWLMLTPLLIAVVVGLVMFEGCRQKAMANERDRIKEEKQRQRDDVLKIKSDAEQTAQRIRPLKNLAEFCRQFEMVNAFYADMTEGLSRYIWGDYSISSLSYSSDGASVSFSVQLPNFEDALRFCYNLDRCRAPESGGTEPLYSMDSTTASPALGQRAGLVTSWSVNGGSGGSAASQLVQLVTSNQIMQGWRTSFPGIVRDEPVALAFTGTLAKTVPVKAVSAFGPPPPAADMGAAGGGMGGGAMGGTAPLAGAGGGG